MKAQQCPICDSKNLKFALKIYYWKEFLLDFDECLGCGATFANPMPTDEMISTGNDALVRLYQKDKTTDQEFREARQAYLRGKVLAKKLSSWKPSGRALELGCYHGFFSLGLKENSKWEVEGLEISEKLGNFINRQLGFKCHVGLLENLNLPENSYDFIICHDLIEHINQPHQFIKQLSRILKPGGRIQIITPNCYQDLAFNRRIYENGMTPTMLLNHILYFTPRALQIALEKAGLRVKKMYCYDVRYTLKDLGYFGMGKVPSKVDEPLSAKETLQIKPNETLDFWSEKTLQELRTHKKVSSWYGFIKETLPQFFTFKVPPALKVGHEIFAVGEKIKD